MTIEFGLLILGAYLVGSVPAAYLAARLFRGIDLRQYGTGQLGAGNLLRTTSKKLAAPIVIYDLGKGAAVEGKQRLRAISLTDNVALATAIANDIGYESIFKEQLVNLLNEGDVVIGLSASGNSPNVLEAIRYAKDKGAIAIGLIGFGGGVLKEIADKSIVLSSRDYGMVEDSHLILEHLLSRLAKARIASGL